MATVAGHPQKASEASDRVLAAATETRVPGRDPAATVAARRTENAAEVRVRKGRVPDFINLH